MSYPTEVSRPHGGSDRQRRHLHKQVQVLAKTLGVVSHRPPPVSGWVIVSDIRVTGSVSQATYVELETRASKVKTHGYASDLGGNTKHWHEDLRLWVDNKNDELMLIYVEKKHLLSEDEIIGTAAKVDLKRLPVDVPHLHQVDNGVETIQLMISFQTDNTRHKPIVPKENAVSTIGHWGAPDVHAHLRKGGMNDYSEFIPTVARRCKHGGLNDYGDFIVSSDGFRMKRGGIDDYADFVLPRGYHEQHGGINDYFTC